MGQIDCGLNGTPCSLQSFSQELIHVAQAVGFAFRAPEATLLQLPAQNVIFDRGSLAVPTRSTGTSENIEPNLPDSLQSLWVSFDLLCIDRSFKSPFRLLSYRWHISPCHIERIGKGSAAARAEEIDRHFRFA